MCNNFGVGRQIFFHPVVFRSHTAQMRGSISTQNAEIFTLNFFVLFRIVGSDVLGTIFVYGKIGVYDIQRYYLVELRINCGVGQQILFDLMS